MKMAIYTPCFDITRLFFNPRNFENLKLILKFQIFFCVQIVRHPILDAVLDNSITEFNPNISESIVLTILHLIRFIHGPPHLHLSYLISPYFERAGRRESDRSFECSQYNASRLALLSLLRNWSGLSYLCHGRAISELLAIFCCNLDDETLLDSLLGLLFDVFDVRLADTDIPEDPDFEDLVKKTQELKDGDAMEFGLDRSFIVCEARHKMRNIYNENLTELGME